MIRNFFSTPNIIGRLMIVLLFVGGVVYAGAFDGFVVETKASSCCGGETDASLFSSSNCNDDPPAACGCCGACDESNSCPNGQDAGCGGETSSIEICHDNCPATKAKGCRCKIYRVCGYSEDHLCSTPCS